MPHYPLVIFYIVMDQQKHLSQRTEPELSGFEPNSTQLFAAIKSGTLLMRWLSPWSEMTQ